MNSTLPGIQLAFNLFRPKVEVGSNIPAAGPVRERFDFANQKGAEIPESYVLPYTVESIPASNVHPFDMDDYKSLSDPNGRLFRVVCENEVPVSNWTPLGEKARKIAEGYNARHFHIWGLSNAPKNHPVRV